MKSPDSQPSQPSQRLNLDKLLRAALVTRFHIESGTAFIDIESWVPSHVQYRLVFTQTLVQQIEVFEGEAQALPSLPWEVIGFDAEISELLEWTFILTRNELECVVRSDWPTLAEVVKLKD